MARLNWVAYTGGWMCLGLLEILNTPWRSPERAVASPAALDQPRHEDEAGSCVLLDTVHHADLGADCVAPHQEQRELVTIVARSPVQTAVDLHHHPSMGHPCTGHPLPWRSMLGRMLVARAGDLLACR